MESAHTRPTTNPFASVWDSRSCVLLVLLLPLLQSPAGRIQQPSDRESEGQGTRSAQMAPPCVGDHQETCPPKLRGGQDWAPASPPVLDVRQSPPHPRFRTLRLLHPRPCQGLHSLPPLLRLLHTPLHRRLRI